MIPANVNLKEKGSGLVDVANKAFGKTKRMSRYAQGRVETRDGRRSLLPLPSLSLVLRASLSPATRARSAARPSPVVSDALASVVTVTFGAAGPAAA
jgi:hypothetical protein